MAGSLNRVQIIGNLGRDPEIRTVNSGDKVANFSIAATESWKTRDGEKKEKTEWINVTVWGDGLVGVIERYVSKGSKLYVEGKFSTRKYEKDGQDRYATEVVVSGMSGQIILLGGGNREDRGEDRGSREDRRASSGGTGFGRGAASSGSRFGGGGSGRDTDLDDEIPF